MGYYIKRVYRKDKTSDWKLQFISQKDGKTKTVDIPKAKLQEHLFYPSMSYDEARNKQALLNKDIEQKRRAAARLKIQSRIESENHDLSFAFPDESEFKKWVVETQRFAQFKHNKFDSNWHCAKKVVAELKLQPLEYAEKKRLIYRWFKERHLSIAYLKRIVRLLNLYGQFHGKTYKIYIDKLEMPKSYDRSDIDDSYHKKNPTGNASKPLTPESLESAQSKLKSEIYNWLYISVWTGMRPSEIDALITAPTYETYEREGVKYLRIYQPKLTSISREKRWKVIPLVEPEQFCILKIIASKKFKRPLVKKIVDCFGDGYGTYSGRKGFTDLMLSREHSLEDISLWLGHQDISMTWKAYKDKQRVHLTKKFKAQKKAS